MIIQFFHEIILYITAKNQRKAMNLNAVFTY